MDNMNKPTKNCPRCNAVLIADDAFCVRCGHNFNTQARPVLTPQPIASPAPMIRTASPATTAISIFGWILFFVGSLSMLIFLFGFDATVANQSSPYMDAAKSERTYNIGLIAIKQCGCIVSGAFTIAGAVLAATGTRSQSA